MKLLLITDIYDLGKKKHNCHWCNHIVNLFDEINKWHVFHIPLKYAELLLFDEINKWHVFHIPLKYAELLCL